MPDIILPGSAGRIEARYQRQKAPGAPMALVLHPHPQFGGTMNNPLVYDLFHMFHGLGCTTVRFNFRGVGRSEGVHDHGQGEQDDVRAALGEMERRFPSLPLVLGGFSFGSVMALRVGGADPRLRAVFALGFPIHSIEDTAFVGAVRVSRLFVQGESDAFGPGGEIARLVEPLPPPRRLVVVPGADHFFTHHLEELQQAVSDWAAEAPWRAVS